MAGNSLVLPDSRLADPIGSQVVEWPMPDGSTVRCEVVKIYCANCGKEYGWCPRDNTTFAFWLCNKCFETYGHIVGAYIQPDAEFCRDVQQEMEDRFLAHLTDAELLQRLEDGRLGTALEKLLRESPYASPDHRSKTA